MNRIYLFFLLTIPSTLYCPSQTITQPGTYIFGNGISYATTTTNDCIIKISSSNVIIDLNQNILSQDSANFTPGLHGIYIDPFHKNIRIKNGTINGMTGAGIYVGDACGNIIIQDCTIQSCATAGVLLSGGAFGITGALLKNCIIGTCTGADGTPAYGVHAIKCNNVGFLGIYANYNDAGITSSGYGFYLDNCSDVSFSQCTAMNNGGKIFGAGIALYQSQHCLLEGVETKNNNAHDTSGTGTACGIYLESSSNNILDSCDTSRNITAQGYGAYGILDYNSQECIFRDIASEFNSGAREAAGYKFLNVSQHYLTDSYSRGNNTTISGIAYGVYLAGTQNYQCQIANTQLLNNNGIDASYGLKDDTPVSSNIIIKNFAFNYGTNYLVTYTTGITLPVTDGSLSDTSIGLPAHAATGFDNISITP